MAGLGSSLVHMKYDSFLRYHTDEFDGLRKVGRLQGKARFATATENLISSGKRSQFASPVLLTEASSYCAYTVYFYFFEWAFRQPMWKCMHRALSQTL